MHYDHTLLINVTYKYHIMVGIFVSLALGIIEYASAIELYRQFIYEETCQSAQMAMFTMSQLQGSGGSGGVGAAAKSYGIDPGKKDLEEFGWLIPFAVDALRCFYWAMDYSLMVF